ncbi:hypothetical protein EDD86DRAFT_278028 [Gorgonomyces haynaldii]|nr:hypothetical protein EDD86DRAFT_278028 [Gorgonomyces haynaldii]
MAGNTTVTASVQPSGLYLYPSAVFHGMAIKELFAIVYLMCRKYSQDRRVIKTPIFYTSLIALFLNLVDLLVFGASLQYIITPFLPDGYLSLYYTSILKAAVFVTQLPLIMNHTVILVRVVGIHTMKSKEFYFLSIMSVIHLMGAILMWFYGFLSVRRSDFFNSPEYTAFTLFAGICVVLDAIINVSAAILFLSMIGKALNVPTSQIMREMMFKHDGAKWILLILLNLYMTYTVILTLFIGPNEWVTVSYHIGPFANFVTLYLFLECSYVAAKDIVQTHTTAMSFNKSSNMSISINH